MLPITKTRRSANLALLIAGTAALACAQQIPLPYPIFDQDAVHEIRITFEDPNWYQTLADNYDGVRVENPYFPAALEWGKYKFDQIGIRFKGNSTYSAARTQKKPFRIKLNEFVKGQKIEGIGSFSLSNAWNDPSYVREKLYYEMSAAAGLKGPRSNFAALYINNEYWGLYVLSEVINSDFLKNYYGKGEDTGNLYKANVGTTFGYLGEDKAAYKNTWEKQSNEDADDWTDLMALTKLITDTPASELKAKLDPVMDTDSVLTALALDNATVNLDSYVGMGQNFNIYKRPSDGRWIWIPWDPSLAFGALSQGQTIDGMKTLALEWSNTGGAGPGGGGGFPGGPGGPPQQPGGGAGRPLATKMWESPEYKERYRQIYQQIADKVYASDHWIERANALRDMIRPWVEKETQALVTFEQFQNAMTADLTTGAGPGGGGPGGPGGPGGGPGGGGAGGGIPALAPFITARAAFVKEKLAESPAATMAIEADTNSIELQAGDKKEINLSLNGTSSGAFYGLTTTIESGSGWLTVTPAGGPVAGKFEVSASGKLDSGTYTGKIKVWSPGAVNSPLEIQVTYVVP